MTHSFLPFVSCFCAFLISWITIPAVIRAAHFKSLVDLPNERKSHAKAIPTLGGLSIFAGILISSSFFKDYGGFHEIRFMIPAIVILFLVGIKDDILILSAKKKFMAQICAAALISIAGDLRIASFYGLFGLQAIPYLVSVALTIFTIVCIINAFNLIDGINGLAGGISFIISTTFGTWFYLIGKYDLAILAYSLSGSVLGFLFYNFKEEASIFMGDTGAMIIGFIMAICAIQFIELNKVLETQLRVGDSFSYWIKASPAVVMGILIVPLFDTLRVFLIRLLKGRSPFVADRNHLHHVLIQLGCGHTQASLILCTTNLLFIILAFVFRDWRSTQLLLFLFALAFVLSQIPFVIKVLRRRKEFALFRN